MKGVTHAAAHILSGGKLLQNQIKTNTPNLYHTSVIINRKYRVERNHLVEVSLVSPGSLGEVMDVNVPQDISISTLLSNAQQSVGKKWYVYNPKTSNCQQFDMSILKANGLNLPQLQRFVDQGAPALLEGVTDVSAITTTAAILDRARQEYKYHMSNDTPEDIVPANNEIPEETVQ